MKNKPEMIKPDLKALPTIKNRMTFLYVEHCQINRENSAITLRDNKGIIHIPAATLSVLLLGPGTNISHRAMELMGDAGVIAIWIGEHGVRYYAGGRPLTHQSKLLMRQAEYVSNQRKHLAVVRKMYQMRFPNENVDHLTLQQLRGREGSRVRKAYKKASKEWNVTWTGRDYDPDSFQDGSPINQALSAANACLYGLAHAVIFALGCSPGLGFVHVGHDRSFVYDIADLYKADITIPVAFEIAAKQPEDLPAETRRRVRDEMVKRHLLEQMVKDIKMLLLGENDDEGTDEDEVFLWDQSRGIIPNGISYEECEDKNDSTGIE